MVADTGGARDRSGYSWLWVFDCPTPAMANEPTTTAAHSHDLHVYRELWRKGATSGDVLELAEIRVNCEQNSVLYLVRRTAGGACHTVSDSGSARTSCYYRVITDEMALQNGVARDPGRC
jgi:phosphoribosyl-AMP cyclohydrolase